MKDSPWGQLDNVVPETSDPPLIAVHMENLSSAIEKRLVGRYDNVAALPGGGTGRTIGHLAFVEDAAKPFNGEFYIYDGSDWVKLGIRLESEMPTFTRGTGAPSGGVNGDVHFRY
jgi:hypothetical protein